IVGLPSDAQAALQAMAVLGGEVDIALLERVASLLEEPLLAALGELLRRQAVEERAPGGLRFAPDKIREVGYARLSRGGRARRPRPAALAIGEIALQADAEARDRHLGELGLHGERAGEPARARPYYLEGARRAAASHSLREAERLYRAYLQLVEAPTPEG